jgi:hypothetical protein
VPFGNRLTKAPDLVGEGGGEKRVKFFFGYYFAQSTRAPNSQLGTTKICFVLKFFFKAWLGFVL